MLSRKQNHNINSHQGLLELHTDCSGEVHYNKRKKKIFRNKIITVHYRITQDIKQDYQEVNLHKTFYVHYKLRRVQWRGGTEVHYRLW